MTLVFLRRLLISALALAAVFPRATEADEGLARATVVVYNEAAPESKTLAEYYARRRGIDPSHLVGLSCSTDEEIDRDTYDQQLAEPLRHTFEQNHWWEVKTGVDGQKQVAANSIRFVALIRGIPLKIRFKAFYPGDHPDPDTPYGMKNEAAVDSELAGLGAFSRQISGLLRNPYFHSFKPITDPETDPRLMLVARLDGPTPADVTRMIDDAIAAEKNGLWGWTVVDERATQDPAYKSGDDWLERIVEEAGWLGRPVLVDRRPGLIPSGFPLNNVILYFGWYSEQVTGALADPAFHFRPGAIAVHIHSFSGASVRTADRFWVGPLLRHGAAATTGNVYEPFLGLTPILDIFFDRLINGMTFAESIYASLVGISWMTTAVGDPLYRPFGENLAASSAGNPWRLYQSLVLQNQGQPERLAGLLLQQGPKEPLCYEFAGLALERAGQDNDALQALLKARRSGRSRDDRFRAFLEVVAILRKEGRTEEAARLIRREGREFRDDPSRRLLETYGL
jgi:uncharacterized protein (TIGR03790 family)